MQKLPEDVLRLVQSYFTVSENNNSRATNKQSLEDVDHLAFKHMQVLEERHSGDLFELNQRQTLFKTLLEQTYVCRTCQEWEHVSLKKETRRTGVCKACYKQMTIHECEGCNLVVDCFESCAECRAFFCDSCAENSLVSTCDCCCGWKHLHLTNKLCVVKKWQKVGFKAKIRLNGKTRIKKNVL